MTYRTHPGGGGADARAIIGRAIGNVIDRRRHEVADRRGRSPEARNRPAETNSTVPDKGLEQLEARQMFSAVSFENGILVVRGNSATANDLNVALSKDGDTITAQAGEASRSVAAKEVRFIRIIGGEQSDIVQVDPAVKVPVYVQTGNGNDTVFTGGGDDLVLAGNGDDWVESSGGNDTVVGGNGRDTLLLGAGDDKAKGGNGSDRIYGGRGNDRIYAENGDDRAWGDAGNDRIETGLGSDRARGGDGRDTLVGQAADDLKGNAGSDNVSRVALASSAARGSVAVASTATRSGITFALINADTDRPVKGFERLVSGSTIDLAKLPSRNLNVRADAVSAHAGSVAFSVNGKRVRVENHAPYALAGNVGADYAKWKPAAGRNVIAARAYAGAGATGAAAQEAAITLTFIDSARAVGSTPGTPSVGGGNGGAVAPGSPDGNEVPNPSARAPVAVITAIDQSVPVGHAVHVHAVASKVYSGTSLGARFEWDFGDNGAKFNKLSGYNAAHVYSRPGQYTVTLRVTDNAGRTDTARTTITIRPSNRTVYYVSAGGSDANDGRSASTPIRSWGRVRQLLADNVEFRFRAGDTFDIQSGMFVRDSNVMFGMYGSGARPTIRWTGARAGSANLFDIGTGTRDVTVRDLRFDSRFTRDTEKNGVPVVFRPGGTNFAAINCEVLNVSYFVNNEMKPTGVLCQENSAPLKTGLRAYLAYVVGSDQVYIGNTVANSTREHCIRSDGGYRILIAHNEFANVAQARPGDTVDIMKQTITVHWGSDVYIHANKTRGGRVEIGPLGAGDGLKPGNILQRLDRVVLDGNDFDFDQYQRVEIDHGTDGVMIRGNRIRTRDGAAVSVEAMAIHTRWPQYGQRNVNNVWMTSDNVVQATKWMTIGRGASNISIVQPGATSTARPAAATALTVPGSSIHLTDASLSGFTTPAGTAAADGVYALRLNAV